MLLWKREKENEERVRVGFLLIKLFLSLFIFLSFFDTLFFDTIPSDITPLFQGKTMNEIEGRDGGRNVNRAEQGGDEM